MASYVKRCTPPRGSVSEVSSPSLVMVNWVCSPAVLVSLASAPLASTLNSTVYSYGDTIAVSFTADRDMLPDPDVYADALRSSFESLKAAALKPAAPKSEANENKPARKSPAKPKPAPKRAAKGGK